MELKDLVITPIYLILIYVGAYGFRSKIKDSLLKKYFIPALSFKLFGAISLGFIYQFHYNSGDTFIYFQEGNVIYNAFQNSFFDGIKLVLGIDHAETFQYTQRMHWYYAPQNAFIIRLVAIFGLFNFYTYSTIACIFGLLSFTGMYKLTQVLFSEFPNFKKQIIYSVFFLPSVIFWGSGIMKDTIIMTCLGWSVYCFYQIFILKKVTIINIFLFSVSLIIINIVKAYVIFSLLPSYALWSIFSNIFNIRSIVLKIILTPLVIILSVFAAYIGIDKLTEQNKRYSFENLTKFAAVQQNYLQRITETKAHVAGRTGSLYKVAQIDGTISSIFKGIPSALNVAFFRPYIFEAKNVVMILSSLEATIFIILFIKLFFRKNIYQITQLIKVKPIFLFFISFSIIFGIGVGLTSGNFGTLVRYRIPFQPFLFLLLIILSQKKFCLNSLKFTSGNAL